MSHRSSLKIFERYLSVITLRNIFLFNLQLKTDLTNHNEYEYFLPQIVQLP